MQKAVSQSYKESVNKNIGLIHFTKTKKVLSRPHIWGCYLPEFHHVPSTALHKGLLLN